MKCPKCNAEITMASIFNPRNGKWTALPLDRGKDRTSFVLSEEKTEAFGILGDSLGSFPIATLVAPYEGNFTPHPPSHYLES